MSVLYPFQPKLVITLHGSDKVKRGRVSTVGPAGQY